MRGLLIYRHLSGWLFLVTVLAGALLACGDLPYTNVNNAELQVLLDKGYTLIDVRRPEEWRQTGVVKDSVLLTFVDSSGRVMPGFIEALNENYRRDEPVILICRTGSRTRTLATYMAEELGYTQIYNVRNGITEWIRDDRPVTRNVN